MTGYRHSIFEIEREKLGGAIALSIATHTLLAVSFFFLPGVLRPSDDPWGDPDAGGGGAIRVGMVQSIQGLNLPRPRQTTQSTIATESKGLGETELAVKEVPREEVPDPKAFEIEDKKKNKEPEKPKPPVKKTPPQIAKAEPDPTVVPFGQGGQPAFAYSQEFNTQAGSGGIGLGDGFFGNKYGWYVRQIRDIVSNNWQKNLVDPNVRSAERVAVQFEILRDGSIRNEFIKESSRIPSLDRSAMRAIKASNFPPLPGGETRLTAEFWFEYSR